METWARRCQLAWLGDGRISCTCATMASAAASSLDGRRGSRGLSLDRVSQLEEQLLKVLPLTGRLSGAPAHAPLEESTKALAPAGCQAQPKLPS